MYRSVPWGCLNRALIPRGRIEQRFQLRKNPVELRSRSSEIIGRLRSRGGMRIVNERDERDRDEQDQERESFHLRGPVWLIFVDIQVSVERR